MKKFLLLLCSLLLIAVGIKADVTVTWESYPGWVRNNVASAYWVGITTPGTNSDTYKMSDFQFCQETGSGASTCYTCIATSAPTSGTSLEESAVLGVSSNAVTATAANPGEYYTYNLASEIELTGGTTYYMVFLSSNTPTDGNYTMTTQRVSLNTGYGNYAAGLRAGNNTFPANWTPGFKATLTTNAAYTVTYTCYSTAGAEIGSGSAEDLVGVFAAPAVAGYKFYKATTTDDAPFDLTQNITADTELKLYYMPYITSLANLSNDKAYIITNARSTWNVADEAESMTTSAFNADANSQKFAILEKQGKYYLFSINANNFLTEANTLGDAKEVFISATENTDYPWFFKFDDSHNVNVDGAGNVLINTFSTIDAGNSNAIVEAGDFDPTAALAAIPFDLSLAITNPSFEESTAIDNTLCGYGKDMAAQNTTYYGLQDIAGWNKVVLNGDDSNANYPNSGMGGAVFAYGSEWQMKGNNKTAPAVGPNGEEGKGLGFFAVWGCGGYYYQNVTLPAGSYTLNFPIYNQSGTQANESYTGFFVNDSDVKYTVAVNPTVGAWTTQSVTFTLETETAGQIRVGYKSTGGGSGANPMLFIDGAKLMTELDGAIDAYNTALAAAQTAATDEVVTGDEKTAVNEAIQASSNIDLTSLEAVKAATEALNNAVKALNDAKPAYQALAAANAMIVDLPYALAEKKPEAKAATNAAAATAAAEEVMAGLRAYYESNAKAENVEGAEVLAEAIVNPAAEDGVNGWTTTLGEGSGGSIGIKDGTAGKEEPWTDAAGSTAHKYFDGGNWGANAWDVSFSQDVTLGAGKYLLSAISRGSGDVDMKLFAGTDSVKTAVIGAAGGVFNRGWNIHNVEFTVEKKGDVKIGVRGVTSVVHNWMSFSDFRLVCLEKAEEPAPAAEDYTDYIVNASLTNAEIGWNAAGTKVTDYAEGAGVVKASNNAQFDFNQTIENLPAGQYKVTAQAAYRYSGSEADEAAAIAAGTETKFASLYATVGTKTVTSLVQNRYDGASETDYANGSGSTTVNGLFVPNSTNAVKAWFEAGQYVNEVVFNLPADGNVTIGIVKTAQPEAGDYTVIGPWTLTRLGDAEVEIPTYTISVADTQNGTVEADKAEAAEGDTVKVTVVPNDGFMVDEAYWTYGETKTEIEKPEEGNAAEFIMPAANVTITVTFKSVKTEWAPGDDATFLIANNSFETGDLTGWTVGNSSDTGVRENSNNTYKTEGCDGNYLFNTWWQGIPITQTVTGLPNGLFELKALMANSSIADGHKPNLYLLANGEHSEAFSSPNAGTFAEGSMQFYVTDGTATIGAIGGNNDGSFTDAGYFWYKVDNFRLTFIEALPDIASIEIPEGKMSNAAAEAITTAKEAGNVVALIAAVKAAKESIEAYANAKNVIGSLENPADNTNVYTAEAKEAFDTYFATIKADIDALREKYEAGTLTDEAAKAATNPMAFGWHADNQFDDFLLSVWSINDVQATDYNTSLYINGWSTEGATDGSNFKVPFFEYWTGDGDSLGEAKLTATMNNLEAGTYDVEAWVRVRIKDDAVAPATGITFQANDGDAVNAADGAQIGESQFYLKEVTATGVVAEDGVLKINFNVAADNNISWLAFKNVKFTFIEAPTPEPTTYAVNVAETANGTVETDKTEATEGETVTVTVTPVEGYIVDEAYWSYFGADGALQKNEFTKPEDGGKSATFVMPAADVTITVTFKVEQGDGINGIAADEKTVIFDMNGRRVSRNAKGVLIINGNKVVRK